MIFKLTGNELFDKVQKDLEENVSRMCCAAMENSGMTYEHREKIRKHLESCARIINKYAPKKKKK